MKLTARIYKINKGENAQCAYFATIKKHEKNKYNFNKRKAILLEINNFVFPTLIRKVNPSNKNLTFGFTIPYKIAKNLEIKKDIKFNFLQKSLDGCKKRSSKDKLNLINLIPRKSIRNFPIFIFKNTNKLLIWIYSKGNKICELPKELSLSENPYDLLEVAGAFFCEGFKARKSNRHRDRFSFSNADFDQINWFAKAIEDLLGISKIVWSVQILYPRNDITSINKMKNYWSLAGFPKDNINLVKNTKTNDKCGVCILNIYNSSLAESFNYIFEDCKKLALSSKQNAIRFFRGLSRGDLGVCKSKNKSISFSTESYDNAIFFKKICDEIGISTSKPLFDGRGKKGYWGIFISHHNNFTKLIKYGCVTHNVRKERLLSKYINARKSRHFDYLLAIHNGHNTFRKLIDHMDIAESTSAAAFIKYQNKGLIIRKKNKGCYVYELSKKGNEELDFYESLVNN